MTIANLQTLTNLLVGATANELTNANFLILLNAAYERITAKIIKETSGARWQFGDFNYTAFPTFTLSMTNGTQSYALTDISTDPLTIMGVEVLDNTGEQHVLGRTSLQEIQGKGIAFDNYYSTDGRPIEYEIRDTMLVLYPAPATANVTLTNGLIIYYLRTADIFTEAQRSTGTKAPGFPSPYHHILAWETAAQFSKMRVLENANSLEGEVFKLEKELLDFIARRDQTERPIMTTKGIKYL